MNEVATPRISRRRAVLIVVAGLAVAGALIGAMWAWIVPPINGVVALTRSDINLDHHGAHVRCDGKGRKERATPLTRQTVAALRVWLAEHDGGPADPVFTTGAGRRLSRDAVAKLVRKHAASAATTCPSIAAKKVTPDGVGQVHREHEGEDHGVVGRRAPVPQTPGEHLPPRGRARIAHGRRPW